LLIEVVLHCPVLAHLGEGLVDLHDFFDRNKMPKNLLKHRIEIRVRPIVIFHVVIDGVLNPKANCVNNHILVSHLKSLVRN